MKEMEKILQYHEGRVWNVCDLKGILTDAQYAFLKSLFVTPKFFSLNAAKCAIEKRIDELEFANFDDEWMAGGDYEGVDWNCHSVYSDGTAEMTLDGWNWFIVRVKVPDCKMRIAQAKMLISKHEKQLRRIQMRVKRIENILND